MDKAKEITELAQQILENIERQEFPLSTVILRCVRLAELTEDQPAKDWFKYELSGYPRDEKGYILHAAFALARYGNRTYFEKDKSGKSQEYMFSETITELESELQAANEQMKVAHDHSVSISSANPHQYVMPHIGNTIERNKLNTKIVANSKKISLLRAAYHKYAVGVYHQQKFKNIADDIFKKRKLIVDTALTKHLPDTFQKFVSAYEKLKSENPEDWSTALTSCRRIIKDVADLLYPATDEEIDIGNGEKLKLDDEHYVARIKQFIKKNQDSDTFEALLGSNLEFVADRLNALQKGGSKGTHAKVTQEEAERYVIYTYMLLGDFLSLYKPS